MLSAPVSGTPGSVASRRAILIGAGALVATAGAVRSARADTDSREAIITRFVAENAFNGVVLLGRGDRREIVHLSGVADAEHDLPLTLDSRFESGSISKWLAAILTLRLVDLGLLHLNAPITTWLPDYRPDTGALLTLRRLMSHSSGLPNLIGQERQANPASRGRMMPTPEAVLRYASGDLAFAPGTQWDYSHSNWIVVKAVVEATTGLPYADLLATLVLEPAGLGHSGIQAGDSAEVPGMALGYATLTPQPERKVNPTPDFLAMTGGFYSSAPDMLALMNAVHSGGLLTPASHAALTTVLMPEQHYALGGRMAVATLGGRERTISSQYGSNGAFRMLARRVLDDGVTVVVLNNTSFDHMAIGALADELLAASYPG